MIEMNQRNKRVGILVSNILSNGFVNRHDALLFKALFDGIL
ncbi:hypothetical protein H1P_10032 [Hyella patelloides LEGE 07179]|uniref:Uncharacterized protein n=1 Tax=Hyella patelloides LEGE 07179 TaxID=945734 RepID=A0A563VIU4_9CYAN|nr:hypothetical protein H1P_10032 [Hyella patelloides LEGE 07179]